MYAPRKVFIIENGSYIELTYQEFCHHREANQSFEDRLFIPLHGMIMEVSKADYDDFHQKERRQKYIDERSADNGDFSYDMLTTDDFNGEDILIDGSEDVETQIERKIMLEKLQEVFTSLPVDEQNLLTALFFQGMSEREWSKASGIPQKTINDRKRRILAKLKKLLEI